MRRSVDQRHASLGDRVRVPALRVVVSSPTPQVEQLCACSYRVTPGHRKHPQGKMAEILQLFDVYSFDCASRVALGLIPLPGIEVMKGEVAQCDCPIADIAQPLGEFQCG